jgi:acetyl esterase/lipase
MPAENRSVLSRVVAAGSSTTYGPHTDNVVEQWQPAARSDITVLLLHGGFWDEAYDRAHCRPLAEALFQQGIRVMLPEYRRVRGAGGWPVTFDDVRAVAGFAVAEAGDGGVLVVGHSAGGHLALWLAAEQSLPGLIGTIALAPVADLVRGYDLGLGDGAVERLMGGTPNGAKERYAHADPCQRLTPHMPVILVHGTRDSAVPIELSHRYVQRHPASELVTVDCGHFELIDPAGPEFGDLVPLVHSVASGTRVPPGPDRHRPRDHDLGREGKVP